MKSPSSVLVRRNASPLLLELDLTRGLLEAAAPGPLQMLRGMHTPILRKVVDALAKAADDPAVAGLVAHVGTRELTLAQSSELRTAVERFRARGKPAVCWSESYGEMSAGNVAYHLATAFDEVWVQSSGDVSLVGVTATAVFVRDALDKLRVQTQLGQRHEYKTAANMFLESAMTDPHREMVTRLVDSAMETLVADVARSRRLSEADVRAAVDAAPLSAADALERGLVDRIGYRDEVYDAVGTRVGPTRNRYVERYGKGIAQVSQQVSQQLSQQVGTSITRRKRPVVAVVSAVGPIHLGRSGGSPLAGRSVGSDSLGAALRAARNDDAVAAVVLRVDSPGGSYVASDAIRREVQALRLTGRPVVASMASVAASGGYYIAMPADEVLASPGTITGSIGVLAGKQVLRDALSRVGIQRESVSAGRYADMFSTERPFDEDEWQRLQGWLDRVYDDFTSKAAADRKLPLDRLREVAKGRVWTGADAVGIGLVDKLGGLAEAVDVAAQRAGLDRGDVEVRVLPRTSPVDQLMPPENSDSTGGAHLGGDEPLLTAALATLGLPAYGALSMPLTWTIR